MSATGSRHRSSRRLAGCLALAALGVVLVSLPVSDTAADVAAGDPVWSTVLENSPLAVLAVALVVGAVRLYYSDWADEYVATVVTWCLGSSAVAAVVLGAIVVFQLTFQSRLKPYFLAADGVIIATLLGLGMGGYAAASERSRAAAAAERDRFAALFENVPSPVVGVESAPDADHVVSVNPAFTEVFGYDREAVLGEDVDEFLVPPDADVDAVGDTDVDADGADGGWGEAEIQLETSTGRRDFLRLTAPVDRDPVDQDGYAVYIDVTDRKQRQQRLEVLSRVFRHDIRNKMTVVDGNAAVLGERVDDDATSDLAASIRDASRDLVAMTERTRAIERTIADAGGDERVDVAALCHTAFDDVRSRFDDESFRLRTDVPAECWASAAPAVQYAVEALVENAVEHSDRDAATVTVSVSTSFDGEYVDVRVADDGPGIPSRERELMTGGQSQTQLDHSSGLGLWFVNWVVTDCGGELSFAENDPRGAVVTMRFPAAAPPVPADD